MNRTIISILCLVSPFTFAEETAVPPVETARAAAPAETPKVEVAQAAIEAEALTLSDFPEASIAQKVLEASEAIGVLMAKSIQSLGINYDSDKIVQGFKDAL